MLHTVNKSPFQFGALESCLKIARPNSPILLYEDGVFAAMPGTEVEGKIKKTLGTNPVYVIRADLEARGITRLIEGVKIIDYSGFVDLVEQNKVQAWF
jgi:tRNA 2-thiouridine synthesizing protein B